MLDMLRCPHGCAKSLIGMATPKCLAPVPSAPAARLATGSAVAFTEAAEVEKEAMQKTHQLKWIQRVINMHHWNPGSDQPACFQDALLFPNNCWSNYPPSQA